MTGRKNPFLDPRVIAAIIGVIAALITLVDHHGWSTRRLAPETHSAPSIELVDYLQAERLPLSPTRS